MQTQTINGSNYTTYKTDIKKQPYTILVVTGENNYISISKDMHWRNRATLGKEFKTFSAASQFYKSAEMKTALMMIEIEFNRISSAN